MKICQVERPLVATNRIAMMEHKHLQVVIDGSSKLVAVDAVGAKPGDWVICVGSSAAREAAGSKGYPSDLTIVGIIDHWPPQTPVDAASKASWNGETGGSGGTAGGGSEPQSTGSG
jgi:ethanolamine utilization protein EutN